MTEATKDFQIFSAMKTRVENALNQGHDQMAIPVEALKIILDQLEVISKSEWKLAGELTELQMNYNAIQLKGDQVPVAWLNDAHLARGHIEGEAGEVDAGPGMIPVYREKYFPPQKPVISKEKLCDWLEDNFDIDDSQRDAFANCFAHHCNCIVKKED
ncbi:hypothetical protein [Rahnella inusitata]|uniref:hypothetical protein n=1 Tax=Rahnella inusitata TaxID=58169 RepID=UPI0039BE5297